MLIIVFLTLIIAGIFVATEFAIVKVKPTKIKQLQNEYAANHNGKSSKKLDRAFHIVSSSEMINEYISTVQVVITISTLILGWIGEDVISNLLMQIPLLNKSVFFVHAISILSVLILTYINVVSAELFPKNVALVYPVKVLISVSNILYYSNIVLKPFSQALIHSSNLLGHLFHLKQGSEDEALTKQELVLLAQESVLDSDSDLNQQDATFIKRIGSFGTKQVTDVFINRMDIISVDVASDLEAAKSIFLKHSISRIPVTKDNDKDQIIGYLYIHDALTQTEAQIKSIIRPILSVSENETLNDTLTKMNAKRSPIAIVKDNFGGTSGLITDKDIIEEIFGEFKDEHADLDEKFIVRLSDNTYSIQGKMQLDYFKDYFSINKINGEQPGATIASIIEDSLKNIKSGSKYIIYNKNYKYEFEVLEYSNHIIQKLKLKVLEK